MARLGLGLGVSSAKTGGSGSPVPPGFPNASNTGLPPGWTPVTTFNGTYTINSSGNYEDILVNGNVIINATDVFFTRCKVVSNNTNAIDIWEVAVTVQDCEIDGGGVTQNGIQGLGDILRNNIHNCENGIRVGGFGTVVIVDNYIHDLVWNGVDPHYDGIAIHGNVSGGANGIIIQHNTIDARDTSCIFMKNDFGDIPNPHITNNLLLGSAGFQIVADNTGSTGSITGLTVDDNWIEMGAFGYWSFNAVAPIYLTGNKDATTGDPIGGIYPVALPASYSSLAGFGDSMTAGSNASDDAHRWLNIVATALSAGTPLNQGISATVLQNSNGGGGTPLVNNGRDRYQAALLASKRRAVAIAYGFNDGRYTGGGSGGPGAFSSANYDNDMREILNSLIQGGYDPSQIILMTPAYITDAGLAAGSIDFSGRTRPYFLEYVHAATNIAAEYGVYAVNEYAYMLANGAGSLIDVDNIHPNDAGHAAMAAAVLASKRALGPTGVTAVATGLSQLTVSWDALLGAASYDVHLFLRGSLAPDLTTTSVTPSIAIGSLPAGEYNVRVRMTEPNDGPWAWHVIPTLVGTTQPLLDTFQGSSLITAHTANIGGGWTSQPGQAVPPNHAIVQNGVVRSNSEAARAAYQAASVVPTDADYEVHAYLVCQGSSSGDQIAVCGRMQAAADTYYFARYNNSVGAGAFSLFARSAGTNTQIGSNFSRTLREGEIVKLSLTMVGSTITMLVDDVSRASGTNATIATAGAPGFYVAGAGTTATNGTGMAEIWMKN